MRANEIVSHVGTDAKQYLGYALGMVAAGKLAFSTFHKVPQGHVALRVHNGSVTRPRDSFMVPEWKEGTLYGRYGAGRPRGLLVLIQHLENLSLMDEVSKLSVPIETPQRGTKKGRRYDMAAAVTWGVPTEFKPDGKRREFHGDITYDTVLVRAATTAGEKVNDRAALRARVEPKLVSGLRVIFGDYEDPRTATDEAVHDALVDLRGDYLMDTLGVELRETAIEESVTNIAQMQQEGMENQGIRFRADDGSELTVGTGGRLFLISGEQDDSA